MTDRCVLGIDTSNYKTSVAVIRGGRILCDLRQFLRVREGERGLRQSDALFQHVQNLPRLFAELRTVFADRIEAVAYSTRPRSVEGSYMPCFTAGSGQAVSIASALNVPAIGFSHQEGHIEAILASVEHRPDADFLACHFSGGTCEVLKIAPKDPVPVSVSAFADMIGENAFYDIEITGGTKDISYGQVLDRAGVAMGLPFPCGEALDRIASGCAESSSVLTPVKSRDGWINLSGFDTQIRNNLSRIRENGSAADSLIRETFEKICDSITKMLMQSAEQTGIREIYMSGGVSSSRFIRETITEQLQTKGIEVYFSSGDYSSDNAVGTAFLGSRYLWGLNQ